MKLSFLFLFLATLTCGCSFAASPAATQDWVKRYVASTFPTNSCYERVDGVDINNNGIMVGSGNSGSTIQVGGVSVGRLGIGTSFGIGDGDVPTVTLTDANRMGYAEYRFPEVTPGTNKTDVIATAGTVSNIVNEVEIDPHVADWARKGMPQPMADLTAMTNYVDLAVTGVVFSTISAGVESAKAWSKDYTDTHIPSDVYRRVDGISITNNADSAFKGVIVEGVNGSSFSSGVLGGTPMIAMQDNGVGGEETVLFSESGEFRIMNGAGTTMYVADMSAGGTHILATTDGVARVVSEAVSKISVPTSVIESVSASVATNIVRSEAYLKVNGVAIDENGVSTSGSLSGGYVKNVVGKKLGIPMIYSEFTGTDGNSAFSSLMTYPSDSIRSFPAVFNRDRSGNTFLWRFDPSAKGGEITTLASTETVTNIVREMGGGGGMDEGRVREIVRETAYAKADGTSIEGGRFELSAGDQYGTTNKVYVGANSDFGIPVISIQSENQLEGFEKVAMFGLAPVTDPDLILPMVFNGSGKPFLFDPRTIPSGEDFGLVATIGAVTNVVSGFISPENATFSDAVLGVGLNIDAATLQWLKDIGAIAGTTTGKVGLGTLLAALLAALMWLKNNKITTPSGGAVGNVLTKTASGVEWAAGGGGGITVDSAFSTTSENPVQNKVVANAVSALQSKLTNVTGFWIGTQAEYDAISPKSETTIYFIKES